MMDEAIRRRIAQAADQAVTVALYGTATTSGVAGPQEPLTLATLQKVMAGLPKPDVFLSSRLFPNDHAICVEGGAERFTCAGPGMWLRVEHETRRDLSDSPTVNSLLGLGGIRIIEIDLCPEDSIDTAKWRASWWDKLREAFTTAMTPLPEWLRAPPRFGKHG
jgi:hypothetical protein